MSADLRIMLATSSAAYEQRVRHAFDGTLNGDLQRPPQHALDLPPAGFVSSLPAIGPDVLAIGPGLSLEQALAIAEQVDLARPEISVVLVAEQSPALWEHALRAGIRDVLSPGAADADVRDVLNRALDTARRRRQNLLGSEPSGSRGRIITVLSPKGGSGKTTVASNLAVGLAAHAPGQVVIVDLDLQFGDVASALRLTPEHSIVDAARGGAADATTVKVFLTPHTSRLYALCAPESPADADDVRAEQAARMLGLLAEEFAYVVVDTCAGLSEHTLAAVEASTDLLLLCAMDVPSVRSLRKEIVALDMLGMTAQRRHFLLNRADARVGLEADDVAATVGMPVDVAVPSSRSVPLSLNHGTPIIESEPRSPAARRLAELVARFSEQPATRSSGLFRRRKEAS